jgi:hypothetical protein
VAVGAIAALRRDILPHLATAAVEPTA